MQSQMLEEMNSLYSDIVFKLGKQHVEITHDPASHPGSVPLPATFTIEAGRRISASQSDMQVRLYSDYPFPWRQDGTLSAFETKALAELRRNPHESFYGFTEADGRLMLRFATARVMQHSCLGCHNGHPDSPKRDWKEGDVRGVLEIRRSLDQDVARIDDGLESTFVLVGVFSALLLALTIGMLLATRPRTSPKP
jgi:hypothetical protein